MAEELTLASMIGLQPQEESDGIALGTTSVGPQAPAAAPQPAAAPPETGLGEMILGGIPVTSPRAASADNIPLVSGPAAPTPLQYGGQTWEQVKASPEYQQGSSERRRALEQKWLEQAEKVGAAIFTKKADRQAFAQGLADLVPISKAPKATIGDRISDLWTDITIGGEQLVGSLGSLFRPGATLKDDDTTFLADFFNPARREEAAKERREGLSAARKDAEKILEERAAAAEGEMGKFAATLGAFRDMPSLVVGRAVQQVPNLLGTLIPGAVVGRAAQVAGVGTRAAAAARAAGPITPAAAELAAAGAVGRAATAGAGAAGGAIGAGQARGQVAEALQGMKEEQWRTDPEYVRLAGEVGADEAKRQIIEERSRLAGVIGFGLGTLAGVTGLEPAALLGKAAASGLRARAARVASELLGEEVEEITPTVLANVEKRVYAPETALTAGVGRTAAETLAAAGGPAAAAGVLPVGAPTAEPGQPIAQPAAPQPPPPAPPTGPETFMQSVERQKAFAQSQIEAVQANPLLTPTAKASAIAALQQRLADWDTAAAEFQNVPAVRGLREESERLARRQQEIEGDTLDPATKGALLKPLTERQARIGELLALNEMSELDLEQYVADREQALLDFDAQRGTGARADPQMAARINEELAQANKILDERAMVQTPAERAFAARERTTFPKDPSGNYVYPSDTDLAQLPVRDAFAVVSDIAQSRIYDARTNRIYERAERAKFIRDARAFEEATSRARTILDAPAEQVEALAQDLTQGLVNLIRQRMPIGPGRINELAAVIARQAEATGERINWGTAVSRANTLLNGFIRTNTPPSQPPPGTGPPPPVGTPTSKPTAPKGVPKSFDTGGWSLNDGWISGSQGRNAKNEAEAQKIVDTLNHVTAVPGGYPKLIVQAMGLRFLVCTARGGGWYMGSGDPNGVGQTAIQIESDRDTNLHVTAHEISHALDDILRTGTGQYLSRINPGFERGGVLRKEIEAWDKRYVRDNSLSVGHQLDFWYPLRCGMYDRSESKMRSELFAQVLGYYHSNRQDLEKYCPQSYAFAKEIFDGLRQLESTGQLDANGIAGVVQQAFSGLGGATGAKPVSPPAAGPAAPSPAVSPGAGVGPAGGGVGAGLRVGGEPQPGVLTEAENAIDQALQRDTAFLSGDAARARQEQALTDAIDETRAEIAARAAPTPATQPGAAPAGAAAGARPAQAAQPGPAQPAAGPAGARAQPAAAPAARAEPAAAPAVAQPRGIAARYGVKTSSASKVRAALAQIFGINPANVARALPNIEIVPLSAIEFVPDQANPTQLRGAVTLGDGSRLTGLEDTTGAFYHPKTNRIVIIADNILDGSERAVIYHELFHKRGGQLLGREQIQRLRDQVMQWGNAPEGSPERAIFDAAMPRVRAALRGKTGEALLNTRDEEVLPYFIEEAVKAGYNYDPKKALSRNVVQRWLNDVGNAIRSALTRAFGRQPKAFDANDLLAAAYGAAQLELPGVGARRAARVLEAEAAFAPRREEITRRGVEYVPERATAAERTTRMRPTQFRGVSPDRVNPIYGSSAEIAAANREAPPPGPGPDASFSIYEHFKPTKAAPVKTRADVRKWAQTQELPTAEWMPQARDRFIENWVDHQRPFYNWLRDNVLSMKSWQELKLIPGKLRALNDRYTREIIDPIAEATNTFAKKYKITPAQAAEVVGQWATMRHIPEANAQLRAKIMADIRAGDSTGARRLKQFDETQRGQHPDDGDQERAPMAGGYTDTEANEIRTEIERRHGVDDLTRIGDMIVDGFAKMKEESLKSGQLSQEAVSRFPKFKHYVALTGTPWDDSASDAFGSYVSPNVLKERGGMTTHVADPALVALVDRIGRVGAYAASADFKAEINNLWEQNGGDNNKIGIEKLSSNTAQSPFDSDVIWQDPKGKRWIFRFTGPAQGVGQAILSKNREYADNLVLRNLDRATRLFSRAVTQWTMSFAPINMLRDIQEKSVLIRSRDVRTPDGSAIDPNAVFKRTWANALKPELWKAAYDIGFGAKANESTASGRLANELVANGGLSTWGQTLRRGRDEIAKEIKRKGGLGKRIAQVDDFVQNYNTMFEVVSSLAAHAAMRELGVDPKTAAFQTLDLMNFQNQGAKTAWIRTMYSFFNPAMQSGRNLFGQLATKRGQRDAMAMAFVSAGLYALAKMLAPDDEELGDKLDQRGSFEVERNLPITIGDSSLKLPVGFGLPQFVWANVVNAARFASGRYDAGSAVAQTATSFLKTFSPIPPSEIEFTKQPNNFLLKSATPTVFRPVVDLATDTNAWGQKLTAFYPDKTKFRSEQGALATPVLYKNLAREMRETTGIDAYPEQWRVFTEGTPLGWGPLGYMLKSVAQSNADMEGRKKDAIDEIPGSTIFRVLGASRFFGGTSRYLDARYHEQYERALVDRREFAAQDAAGKGAAWLRANPERARRIEALRAQETEMRALTKDYNAIIRSMQGGTINLDSGQRQLQSIADRREKQMRGFLRLARQWDEDELGEPEEVE
jgi:hypothetical protein